METTLFPGRTHSATDDDPTYKVEAIILEARRITIRQLAQNEKISVRPVEMTIQDHLRTRKLLCAYGFCAISHFLRSRNLAIALKLFFVMCEENEVSIFSRIIRRDET